MDVDLIIKIAAAGLLVAAANQILSKAGREELAMFTTIAGIIVVLMLIINEISALFTSIRSVFKI